MFLVKECVVEIECKENEAKDMNATTLSMQNQFAISNLLLALDDSILFNVPHQTTMEDSWVSYKESTRAYEKDIQGI